MLGGGVIVQRFGDLIKGRRSTEERIGEDVYKRQVLHLQLQHRTLCFLPYNIPSQKKVDYVTCSQPVWRLSLIHI